MSVQQLDKISGIRYKSTAKSNSCLMTTSQEETFDPKSALRLVLPVGLVWESSAVFSSVMVLPAPSFFPFQPLQAVR